MQGEPTVEKVAFVNNCTSCTMPFFLILPWEYQEFLEKGPFFVFLPVEHRSYNRVLKISSTILKPPPTNHLEVFRQAFKTLRRLLCLYFSLSVCLSVRFYLLSLGPKCTLYPPTISPVCLFARALYPPTKIMNQFPRS